MPTHPDCAKMTKMPRGKFPNRSPVKHCLSTNLGSARHNSRLKSWLCSRWHEMSFFIEETIAVSAVVIPVHHCYDSRVPSVQRRHGNYAIRKFLSSLGNFRIAQCWLRFGITQASLVLLSPCSTFPSRISFRYAENVPTEPKGAAPWRTPIRLYEKPYTPIVPQANAPCL
jgi:hypothetical protein